METCAINSVLTPFERVCKVIERELGISRKELKLSTTFVSLVTDSLEMLNLIIELEAEFGIEIAEPEKVFTIEDAIKLVPA